MEPSQTALEINETYVKGCRAYGLQRERESVLLRYIERSSIAIDRSASGRRACACVIGPMKTGPH